MGQLSLGSGLHEVFPLPGDTDSPDFGITDSPPRVIRPDGHATYLRAAMKFVPLRAFFVGLGAAVAISACGQTSSASQETPAQIWHEVVQCARTHGDPNFPDPTIDSQGRATFPPGTQKPSAATMQACQSIYNRLPPSARGIDSVDIQMEIRFAQCMRAQGLTDWPDPNPDGSYPLPADLRTTSKSGPVWDRIRAAWDACRAYNPSGSISVAQS